MCLKQGKKTAFPGRTDEIYTEIRVGNGHYVTAKRGEWPKKVKKGAIFLRLFFGLFLLETQGGNGFEGQFCRQILGQWPYIYIYIYLYLYLYLYIYMHACMHAYIDPRMRECGWTKTKERLVERCTLWQQRMIRSFLENVFSSFWILHPHNHWEKKNISKEAHRRNQCCSKMKLLLFGQRAPSAPIFYQTNSQSNFIQSCNPWNDKKSIAKNFLQVM